MGREFTKVEADTNGLIITIAGRSGRGKTTVARFIEEMLRREGFLDVTVFDDPADSTPDKLPIDKRVAATKERIIVIETVMTKALPDGSYRRTIAPGEVPTAED